MLEEAIANNLIPSLVIGGGMCLAAIAVIGGIASGVMKTREHQRTAREVAAYVAEGSMTTDEGERLLKASAEPKGG